MNNVRQTERALNEAENHLRPIKLSVVVPVFNSENTLRSCLQAIKNSSFSNIELIVVDDGSTDQSASIAKQFADKIVLHGRNLSRIQARNTGMEHASGDIIAFIDSDIVIGKNSLEIVSRYFKENADVTAITGLLSDQHPNQDFFSQYKNLYMNYVFKKLPKTVTFLFGSIFAIRKSAAVIMVNTFPKGEDTALGQELSRNGEKISFLRNLEVVHLKKYTFLSWIKNDFEIPFNWTSVFLAYRGWKQLGKNRVGFAHSPIEQLLSLGTVGILGLTTLGVIGGKIPLWVQGILLLVWVGFNTRFFLFLLQKRGALFLLAALFATLLDHVVMIFGITSGLAYNLIRTLKPRVQ